MSEIFLDTNICVYAFDSSAQDKREKAKSLLKKSPLVSSQVIIETYLACSRKLKLSQTICEENTRFLCDLCSLIQIDSAIFFSALHLKSKYQFSVATALQADCAVLYSEDMQHNQFVEGKLKIINPFQ